MTFTKKPSESLTKQDVDEKNPSLTTTTATHSIFQTFHNVLVTELKLWKPKAVFIFFGFSQTMFHNFISIYFREYRHYAHRQVGYLQGMSGWCTLIAPPIWGAIADIIGRQRLVHNICILTAACLIYLLYHIHSFPLMMVMVFLAYFQTAPVYSLLDQAVMKYIDLRGFGEYGRQRLFAAVGNGVGAVLGGAGSMHMVFVYHVIFAVCCFGVLQGLPVGDTPKKKKEETIETETPKTLEAGLIVNDGEQNRNLSFSKKIQFLLTKLDIVCLLLVAALFGICHGCQQAFLYLYLRMLTGTNSIVGTQIILETISEIPAFFFAACVLRKIGIVKVLLLSLVAYALRFFYYSLMTNATSALPFALFHGINYSLTWAALTEFVFKAAPVGMDGTTMGLLAASHAGIGKVVGAIVGGEIANAYGYAMLWTSIYAGLVPITLLAVVGLAIALRHYEKKTQSEEESLSEQDRGASTSSYHDVNDSYRRSSTFGPAAVSSQVMEIEKLPVMTPKSTPRTNVPYTFTSDQTPTAVIHPSEENTPKVPYAVAAGNN